MSEVLPYEENISHYGDDGDEEQLSLTCRLQNNSSNFFSSTQNKRAPKLGQIGRSKRVVIEDDRIDEVLNNTAEKSSAGVAPGRDDPELRVNGVYDARPGIRFFIILSTL
ncbi:hypothetical protein QQF64_021325 [Cirrhinus molitorella]|uniref:Uncharacterized protein n=2 Tax=Cirrhinus molitorella TaxID=172907 RepID=A0ABR3LD33_9TELE